MSVCSTGSSGCLSNVLGCLASFDIFPLLWFWGRGPLLKLYPTFVSCLNIEMVFMNVICNSKSMLNNDIQLCVYASFGILLPSLVYTQNWVWECGIFYLLCSYLGLFCDEKLFCCWLYSSWHRCYLMILSARVLFVSCCDVAFLNKHNIIWKDYEKLLFKLVAIEMTFFHTVCLQSSSKLS